MAVITYRVEKGRKGWWGVKCDVCGERFGTMGDEEKAEDVAREAGEVHRHG